MTFRNCFFNSITGMSTIQTPDETAIAAMETFADKTVAFFMGQVRLKVGDIPVMFAVGNADSYLGALPEPSYLIHNAELYYTQFLNSTVDHTTFISTFTKGGYYSAEPAGTNLLVIGLNSVMFNYDFEDILKTDVDAELAWFDSQLAQAKASGKKVWLLMHIPPGADKYSTAQNNLDVNGHLTTATMMWNQDYQARFLKILSHYPGTIALTLGAHTHMDEYRIMSPENVLEITPGITPYFGNNPAFRVITFSRYTYKPTDYSTLNCDLSAGTPHSSTAIILFRQRISCRVCSTILCCNFIRSLPRIMQNNSFTEDIIFPDIIIRYPSAMSFIPLPIRPGLFTGAA